MIQYPYLFGNQSRQKLLRKKSVSTECLVTVEVEEEGRATVLSGQSEGGLGRGGGVCMLSIHVHICMGGRVDPLAIVVNSR